jgi:hypothetical protein
MFVENVLSIIGWVVLIMSWVVPYVMRKQADTFNDRMKSYNVGVTLSAVALAIFAVGIVVHFTR